MSDGDIWLSVDPGLSGALSWVTGAGHLIEVVDMPVIEVVTNGKKRRKIDAAGLVALMGKRPVTGMIVEAVIAMPRRGPDGLPVTMGATSSNSAARGAGILEGIAAALGLPYSEVMPHVWKRRASVPKDKGGARLMAQRTWPGAFALFARVKDDGRAESALLGRWAALGR
jgi:crossover junction endodeoxyribonuclease RuvC